MKTTIQQSEDKYLITLEGEMDTAAAVEVEKQRIYRFQWIAHPHQHPQGSKGRRQ